MVEGPFPAMELRDAIGDVADGIAVDPEMIPYLRAAVSGSCATSDEGEVEFVVDVSGCRLFYVDTEELIWPRPPGDPFDEHVPLRAVTDRDLWARERDRWGEDHPDWVAFVWRVAVPLSNRLLFVGAWRL